MADDDRFRLKWLENDNKNRAKRSKKQELRIAQELGGRRLKQSGASRWSKWDKATDNGDIETPEFHVEHKRTEKKSISLKREWLEKVSEGAFRTGKIPSVVITFEFPNSPSKKEEDWMLVPLSYIKNLDK